jgi:hypothetical protein
MPDYKDTSTTVSVTFARIGNKSIACWQTCLVSYIRTFSKTSYLDMRDERNRDVVRIARKYFERSIELLSG